VGFVVKKKEPQRAQRRHRGHKEEVHRKTLGELCVNLRGLCGEKKGTTENTKKTQRTQRRSIGKNPG
jgi:hypothetical protein